MVHDELAAAVEKIGQRYLAVGRIKFIALLYLFPGQSAALAAQFIAQAGELFLFGQELAAGGKPFLMRNDVWVFDSIVLLAMVILLGWGWSRVIVDGVLQRRIS